MHTDLLRCVYVAAVAVMKLMSVADNFQRGLYMFIIERMLSSYPL